MKIIFKLGAFAITEPDMAKGFINMRYEDEEEAGLAKLMQELDSAINRQIKENRREIEKNIGTILGQLSTVIRDG